MKIAVALLAVWVGVAAGVAEDGAKVFNVRSFGAKGDGSTFDTAAIQKRWTPALIPAGPWSFPPAPISASH